MFIHPHKSSLPSIVACVSFVYLTKSVATTSKPATELEEHVVVPSQHRTGMGTTLTTLVQLRCKKTLLRHCFATGKTAHRTKTLCQAERLPSRQMWQHDACVTATLVTRTFQYGWMLRCIHKMLLFLALIACQPLRSITSCRKP